MREIRGVGHVRQGLLQLTVGGDAELPGQAPRFFLNVLIVMIDVAQDRLARHRTEVRQRLDGLGAGVDVGQLQGDGVGGAFVLELGEYVNQ